MHNYSTIIPGGLCPNYDDDDDDDDYDDDDDDDDKY